MKSLKHRKSFALRLGLSRAQAATIARLDTPGRIQDFINAMPINFEPEGDTCLSVAEALRQRRAHCIEGAFIAACALWCNGEPPLLMDFNAHRDDDHVIALFRRHGCWGAISKSNHVWLRWREPIYRSLRELAMSYFHEYVGRGRRSLRAYSVAFDLRRFDSRIWVTGKKQCWEVANAVDETRHYQIMSPAQIRNLRRCDRVEVAADKITEYKRPRNMRKNKAKQG